MKERGKSFAVLCSRIQLFLRNIDCFFITVLPIPIPRIACSAANNSMIFKSIQKAAIITRGCTYRGEKLRVIGSS